MPLALLSTACENSDSVASAWRCSVRSRTTQVQRAPATACDSAIEASSGKGVPPRRMPSVCSLAMRIRPPPTTIASAIAFAMPSRASAGTSSPTGSPAACSALRPNTDDAVRLQRTMRPLASSARIASGIRSSTASTGSCPAVAAVGPQGRVGHAGHRAGAPAGVLSIDSTVSISSSGLKGLVR